MKALGMASVPVECLGYALFLDEDRTANDARCLACLRPCTLVS
jgi:hypothetical protein